MKPTRFAHLVLATALFLPLVAPAQAVEAMPSRRDQAHTCTACHGEYGQKEAPGMPRIGGRDYFELLAAMASFRNAERFHPAMTLLMLSLDEAQMAATAEYFANIDPAGFAHGGTYGGGY